MVGDEDLGPARLRVRGLDRHPDQRRVQGLGEHRHRQHQHSDHHRVVGQVRPVGPPAGQPVQQRRPGGVRHSDRGRRVDPLERDDAPDPPLGQCHQHDRH